uniref:Reverse transcriptase domain-containing protein n=1 Tax=Tanacetum cinerariifolium TaxID=118510 RepID=A0A699I815_TANCI|nr:reverse transcriptase domain-containing protein [Tanacetum cinerariifolium]
MRQCCCIELFSDYDCKTRYHPGKVNVVVDALSRKERVRAINMTLQVNIFKSIDEGPFQMGTFQETLFEGNEDALHLGPDEPRVYSDLSPKEKERYNADIRATNILLQGLPKDIYTLINHYTDANDIWDNVKMLMEGSELTKEDRESQLVQVNNTRGAGVAGYEGAQNRVGNANSEYFKDKMLLMQAQENGVALDEEHLLFIVGGQDNDVDEDASTAQTMFMANLSFADHVYDEAGLSYDSNILSEVHDHDHYQDAVCEHHKVHEMHEDVQRNYVVDSHADYTSDSNMILYDQYDLIKMKAKALKEQTLASRPMKALTVYPPNTPATLVPRQMITDCLSKDVFYTATDSVLTVFKFSDIHEALNVAQKRIVELESKISNLKNKIQNDDHDVMVKKISKLEVEHLNFQLKYQHLKESFENKKSVTSSDAPTFDLVFVIGQLKDQVQSRGNMIYELREKISRLTKKHSDADPIHDLKALYSQNKELHAKFNAIYDLNKRWRAENEKVKRNNKEVHLDYLKHLMESVATLHEIIKEARVEKPFDSSLASACRYTKHSQELVEYVIGTFPNDFNKGDKHIASTPVTRKKRVTFMDPCKTFCGSFDSCISLSLKL